MRASTKQNRHLWFMHKWRFCLSLIPHSLYLKKCKLFLHIYIFFCTFAAQLYNKLPYVTKNILENTIHQPLY